MADTPADELVIRHHDDRITRYRDVRYCLWAGGVTIYRDGAQIARHTDVIELQALALAAR
ncbi:hypothetical protein [Actinoplanes aureus]|uniref:Uncharacterized protein n=1 Tax=Actinoplanes aureus TaxID=2792083 RepID=A0A931CC07_9ACTN|nr:hypothetical protein [Actinoplanes aureus]MBG0564652.1 hypothetical protein [Actinoplanes aureus]